MCNDGENTSISKKVVDCDLHIICAPCCKKSLQHNGFIRWLCEKTVLKTQIVISIINSSDK